MKKSTKEKIKTTFVVIGIFIVLQLLFVGLAVLKCSVSNGPHVVIGGNSVTCP